MLETVRAYAAERFEASGDVETWRQRHADYYLALAGQAAPELTGRQQARWLERLEREHDNLRAALTWAIERDEAELALRLAGALGRFWEMRGHFVEGRRWLDRTLSRWPAGPAAARAVALNAAGSLAYHAADYERAALHEQALELRRRLSDRRGIASSLHNLGITALHLADLDRAEALCVESRMLWREAGDERGVAISLNSSPILARNRGDHEQTQALSDESLAIFRSIGDTWGVGMVLNNLARLAREREDWDRVAALAGESLALFQELGDRRGIAWVLGNLMVVAGRRGCWEQAARLHGAAEALRESVGELVLWVLPCWTGNPASGERALAPLRALARPIADAVSLIPYPRIYDYTAHQTVRHGWSMRSMFADDLSEATYARLADVRRAYDPHNLFRFNQNVLPRT